MGSFNIDIEEHHWLANTDPAQDLCSHGRVFVRVDGEPIVTPADGEFTLSAAALYLLRTLERDHSLDQRVGEHLLPCCGNSLIAPDDGPEEVIVLGCPNGIDWQVTHQGDSVRLHDLVGHPPFSAQRELDVVVPAERYRKTVHEFATAVWSLFDNADKHASDPEDEAGYRSFTREYVRRLGVVAD